jgi:hypothetical protein
MKPLTKERLRRLQSDIEKWGVLRILRLRLMRFAKRKLGIFVNAVRTSRLDPDPDYPMARPDIEMRVATHEELITACLDPKLHLSEEFVDAAKRRGDICYGAFHANRIVSYTWRAFGAAPHGEMLCVRAQHPYSYSYKSYTRPDYRGNRITPSLILRSDVDMLDRGFTNRVGFVEVTNYESLAMGKRIGAKVVGYAGYLRWFGRYFPFRTPGVRKTGFEFFEPDQTPE